MSPSKPITRLRKICLALPDAYELETWDIPTFRIGKKIFCLNSDQDDRPAIWFKVPAESKHILLEADGGRFFKPPYFGHKGWVGMFLDKNPDWDEVAFMVVRSFNMTAPKRRQSPTRRRA